MNTFPNEANNYGGMTDLEILNLTLLWGADHPQEPNAYDFRLQWAKFETETLMGIQGFFAPDFDEGTLFEDQIEREARSYILWT